MWLECDHTLTSALLVVLSRSLEPQEGIKVVVEVVQQHLLCYPTAK